MAIHLSVVAAFLPITLVLYTVWKLFYNIFLHPLRSFPGPLLARSTVLAYNKHVTAGDSHVWIKELHDKYGPVVRISPNELAFNQPGAWKDIYGFKRGLVKDLKFYGPDAVSPHEPGLVRANDDRHAKQRKLFSHAFSDRALSEQQELIQTYANRLCDRLSALASKNEKADMCRWFNHTTFDVMADMTFGEPMGLLDGSEHASWVDHIFELMERVVYLYLFSYWPALSSISKALMPKNLKERLISHQAFATERVNKRLARTAEKPDIWSFVDNKLSEKEGGVTRNELTATGATFMIAGTETTATELSGLMYTLCKSPEKMKRLVDEIRGAFSSTEEMTLTKLSHLPYLNACIDEGLRYYPPIANGLPRVVVGDDIRVSGNYIPKGATVTLYQWAANRSSSNFHRPDEFLPERWLPEGQPEFAGDRKDAVNPFSYGPRSCIGKNMAYHELRIVLATILFRLDFELCPESDGWIDNQKVYFVWRRPPLMVKMKAR